MHEQSGSDTNIKYYGKNCSNEKLTKAVEIILEEMKKKDEIIKELKYQNEILQKSSLFLSIPLHFLTLIHQKLI